MSNERLLELLRPIAKHLAAVDLSDPAAATRQIEETVPYSSEQITLVRREAERGANEGWLLPNENGGIRYGRIAKDVEGFSVDAVLMAGPGPRHRHGNGEIDLCFATNGSPRFDGHGEGWVVYEPGSIHVPTVTDGEMLILYFLPGGDIEFIR